MQIRVILLFILILLCLRIQAQSVSGWTKTELKNANTAANADFLTSEEKNVILYTNLARMYPKKFAELEVVPYDGGAEFGHYLVGSTYKASLLYELRTRKPIGPVYPDFEMYQHAKCWAMESGQRGITGHTRISCASPSGCYSENCSYGKFDGRRIVLQLLIDHDVPSLGHRKNILNPTLVTAGPSIQPHTEYRHCCVINYGCSQNTSYTSGKPLTTRYYQRNGVKYISLLSAAYSYSYNGNDALSVGLFGFRYRKFQMELLSVEAENVRQTIENLTNFNIQLGYTPKIGLVFPISRLFAIGTHTGLVVPYKVCQTLYDAYSTKEPILFKQTLQQCQLPIGLSLNLRNWLSLFAEYRQPLSDMRKLDVQNLRMGLKLNLGFHWN